MAGAAASRCGVQGLRRHYAFVLTREGTACLVKSRDDVATVLAEQPFAWALERPYAVGVTARGRAIACSMQGRRLFAVVDDADPFDDGGIGLLIEEGALSTAAITVGGAFDPWPMTGEGTATGPNRHA